MCVLNKKSIKQIKSGSKNKQTRNSILILKILRLVLNNKQVLCNSKITVLTQ